VIGISDPGNPVEAGACEAPPGRLAISGNYLYVASYGSGLWIYEMAPTFGDVPADFWSTDAIERCVTAGVVKGYGDGIYRPTTSVDRAQMAAYIARVMVGGDDNVPDAGSQVSFPDVQTGHWAHDYVEYARAQGVVAGYRDGRYHPEITVDRGQMAVYIARSRGWVNIGDDMATAPQLFPDVPAGFWAGTAVEACMENGVVQGYEDGLYRPGAAVTRDQMAVYVARAFELAM
jgi:hypothetical protein